MSVANFISVALKGFLMGAANVVPGVSGGTIALLTGIYSKIVGALDSVTDKNVWKALLAGRFREFWTLISGSFLTALAIGLVVSVLSLAKLVTVLIQYYPVLVWAFFLGLIIASLIVMFRDYKGIYSFNEVLMIIIGIALGLALCMATPANTPDDLWFIFVCGAIAICTMILPGVSGSFVLLIFNKYTYIMDAISSFNIPVIIVFGIGCVVGILAFAKLLNWLLKKWERQTMFVLMGFVIGTIIRIWPWYDMDAVEAAQVLRTGAPATVIDLQIPYAIVCGVIGFILILLMNRYVKTDAE